jgi:ABC-type lipopolysaccharide export system ATPase subunit
MLENIALIKEVHEHLETLKAQDIAREMLKKISHEHVALYRVSSCSPTEIFYIQFIRALMMREEKIMIVTPFSLIDNLRNINVIIKNIEILAHKKHILIVDMLSNEIHYQGTACNTVK